MTPPSPRPALVPVLVLLLSALLLPLAARAQPPASAPPVPSYASSQLPDGDSTAVSPAVEPPPASPRM